MQTKKVACIVRGMMVAWVQTTSEVNGEGDEVTRTVEKIGVSLPPELVGYLRAMADSEMRSVSNMLARMIEAYRAAHASEDDGTLSEVKSLAADGEDLT